MSKSMNIWIGAGTIGRDAEVAHTSGGKSVVKLSIATSYGYKDSSGDWKEITDWHNIVYWNGEKLAPYLLKGTKITVQGRYTSEKYTDKNGNEKTTSKVIADNIVLMGSGGGGGGSKPSTSVPDEDIPF